MSWTSEDASGGSHLFSQSTRATGVGVRNFPEDCPVHSLLESETNQASRENLVQEKKPSSQGFYTNPTQRGVHVPGPDHLPEPWREAGASLPALRRGAPEPGSRVLTLAGGTGRGEVNPRAAPIR